MVNRASRACFITLPQVIIHGMGKKEVGDLYLQINIQEIPVRHPNIVLAIIITAAAAKTQRPNIKGAGGPEKQITDVKLIDATIDAYDGRNIEHGSRN